MPIEVDSEVCVFCQEQFHALAEKVIGVAFEVHNDLGRLHEEQVYKQATLYRDALIHFFGGPERVLRRIPVYDRGAQLGTHEVCLIGEATALAVTAAKEHQRPSMTTHLRRVLAHTSLAHLQWVHTDNHDIELQTFSQ